MSDAEIVVGGGMDGAAGERRTDRAVSLHRPEARLRIAMLAPPWISVPPPGYGGVESVVGALTETLVGQGHDVTLFCAPGSESSATVVTLLANARPEEIERSLYEVDHVARAFALIDAAPPDARFDVLHDHCGFTALAMADRLDTPIVHTLHGQFTPSTAAFYSHHGHKAALVALSGAQLASAPPGLGIADVIPNPLDLSAWPLQERKSDYLLWIGRMSPVKGPHRAIEAARHAGVPLILAGVIQPGQQAFFDGEIAPHVDGDRVRFVGEVSGGIKRALFAEARALLMPIRWDEPFGMVMVEALACGTPVIAFPEGAAREIVRDGETGFLVDSEAAMGAAVAQLSRIAPTDCRAWVAAHCDVGVVARAYERVYRQAAGVSELAGASELASLSGAGVSELAGASGAVGASEAGMAAAGDALAAVRPNG
jgi:glycosyltransferase involved in cell wall biosynthesis